MKTQKHTQNLKAQSCNRTMILNTGSAKKTKCRRRKLCNLSLLPSETISQENICKPEQLHAVVLRTSATSACQQRHSQRLHSSKSDTRSWECKSTQKSHVFKRTFNHFILASYKFLMSCAEPSPAGKGQEDITGTHIHVLPQASSAPHLQRNPSWTHCRNVELPNSSWIRSQEELLLKRWLWLSNSSNGCYNSIKLIKNNCRIIVWPVL